MSTVNPAAALSGIDFPCSKEQLMEYAARHGASPDMQQRFRQMAERQYANMADVMHEYGNDQ